jgi:hypothetical protein
VELRLVQKGRTLERGLHPIFQTYGGRRLRKKLEQRARVRATKIVENMSKQVEFADDRAKLAVRTLVETLEARLPNGLSDAGENADASTYVYSIRDRHAAVALLLKYIQPVPTVKTEVTVQTAEGWLASLAADDGEE